MDIHFTIKTNKSWEVVYVIKKVRQLFCIYRVSEIVSSILWKAVHTEKNSMLCCILIDAFTTSNDV